MDQKLANSVLRKLDETAGMLEKLSKQGKIEPRVAAELVRNIDAFADKFQVAAYGEESFKAYQNKVGKVIQREPDEPYMDTFQNPQKVIESDPDEPYMHESGPSYNSKSIKTYDSDDTSQVTERDEYDVRELNESAGGTKPQPTWSGGSAGKSTKQGSSKKTWA